MSRQLSSEDWMRKQKSKGGRPTNDEGPKLAAPHEVERLLVEGELVVGPTGEAERVWLTQRDIATRYEVSCSSIADFAKKRGTTERREAFRRLPEAEQLAFKPPPPPIPPAVADHNAVEDDDADDESPPQAPPPEGRAAPSTEQQSDRTERRKPGRPRHQDSPVIPWDELDRALVFGEVEVLESGKHNTTYPTYRALAERYGVVPSIIADYARSHNTMKRRKVAATRVAVRTEEKLIELRSDVMAVGEARLVSMIDDFLLKFEESLKEGRVRTDNPGDVNTMARLKQFVMGGADSRQEVRAILSLDSLQERYARSMRESQNATPAMGGVVIDVREAKASKEDGRSTAPSARFSAGGAVCSPAPSAHESGGQSTLSEDLHTELQELLSLSLELGELVGEDEPLGRRLLRAAAAVESRLGAHMPGNASLSMEDEA